ncbi:MAG: non-hydrolyzing UDP-N-acetylglucosamine 2-epimerase [Flavobacteriia bacterium]|jgi:UDP-GlcNAc3NAcA epimerase|nr:UDP-N-acetylglucosamine 2-epimerase (non-hydrolyzing) [Cryomorphaceae bacterium]
MKRIITIVGARPQIIKSSAISRAVNGPFKGQLEEIIVHTGQHYDENMSDVFFNELMIPLPQYNLGVGSASHGAQTAAMIEGLEKIFEKEKPDGVLVYGDTNSTIAAALAAIKMHIPVIHVEAGLRSFNKSMPEEVNRIACDHMSTLLFTPTVTGLENLKREGFVIEHVEKASADHPKVYHCGDVMYDNSLHFSELSSHSSSILKSLNLEGKPFLLVTVHRDSNTDIASNLQAIFKALLQLSQKYDQTIVLPLHPRTRNMLEKQLSLELYQSVIGNEQIKIIPPAGFLDIIALEKNATMMITDSGGLQKEAFFFKKTCIILREQTEWIEIVKNGNAVLTGASEEKILDAYVHLIAQSEQSFPALYGDGKAAEFICQKMVEEL